jgi:hypothetical protein
MVKQTKEYRQGSVSIFCLKEQHISLYIYIDIDIYLYIYIYAAILIHTYTENRTNGKQQLPLVCCKRKTEVYFPWLANDKW